MSQNLLELAYQLTQAGKPFVLATVVWCERPTSAKPGAQAIIQDDGQIGLLTGWVGGSCTQPVVLREALRSLRQGDDPYLLRVGASDKGIARDDVRIFPMTCTSGGVIDIYMEPHLPQPQLVLVGASPVAHALAQLAPVLNFSVIQTDSADLNQIALHSQTYILVATHGQYDEDVLEHVLRSPARYIGIVASHRRADSIRDYLRTSQLSEEQIARLKAPAGLDTGAVTPEEIASS
nr:XdhC family protein [Ktedonobacteraceae bacterium]